MLVSAPLEVYVLYDPDHGEVMGVFTDLSHVPPGTAMRVQKRQAVYVEEGTLALLDHEHPTVPVNVMLPEHAEKVRERALAKLTKQERRALGVEWPGPTFRDPSIAALKEIFDAGAKPSPEATWDDLGKRWTT